MLISSHQKWFSDDDCMANFECDVRVCGRGHFCDRLLSAVVVSNRMVYSLFRVHKARVRAWFVFDLCLE